MLHEITEGPAWNKAEFCRAMANMEQLERVPATTRRFWEVLCGRLDEISGRQESFSSPENYDFEKRTRAQDEFLRISQFALSRTHKDEPFASWWSHIYRYRPLSPSHLQACAAAYEFLGTLPASGQAYLQTARSLCAPDHAKASDSPCRGHVRIDLGSAATSAASMWAASEACLSLRDFVNERKGHLLHESTLRWQRVLSEGDTATLRAHLNALQAQLSEVLPPRELLCDDHSRPASALRKLLVADAKVVREEGGHTLQFLDTARFHARNERDKRKVTFHHKPATGLEDMQLNSAFFQDNDTGLIVSPGRASRDELESAVSFGQRAETFLESMRVIQQRTLERPPPPLAGTIGRLRVAIAKRERACPPNTDKDAASALGQGRALVRLIAHHIRQCSENNLLGEQVLYMARHCAVLCALCDEASEVLQELTARSPTRQPMPRHPNADAATGVPLHVATPLGGAEDATEGPSPAQLGSSPVEAARTSVASLCQEHDDDDDQVEWLTAGRRPRGPLQPPLRRRIQQHFHPGTFPSATASCLYHFRKHAPPPRPGSADDMEIRLTAYLDDALAARAKWGAAVSTGQAYLAASLCDPGQLMRVIDAPDLFLVATNEDDGMIVSFRDRAAVGR